MPQWCAEIYSDVRWAQSSLVRFSPFFVIFFAFVFLQFTDDVWLAISTPKQQMAERIQQTMMMLIFVHKRKNENVQSHKVEGKRRCCRCFSSGQYFFVLFFVFFNGLGAERPCQAISRIGCIFNHEYVRIDMHRLEGVLRLAHSYACLWMLCFVLMLMMPKWYRYMRCHGSCLFAHRRLHGIR